MLTCILGITQVSFNTNTVFAAVTAIGTNTSEMAITSASWGLIPSNTVATPAAGTVLTISNPSHPTPSYFHLVNVGTLDVSTFSLSVEFTGLPGANSFQIKSCSTTWNETTGLCPSGTITTVLDSTGATTPVSQNGIAKVIAAGTQTSFQIVVSKNGVQLRITATVTNSDVRAPITTNS
jgi:hypothetical protein